MSLREPAACQSRVTPFVGVWIEIYGHRNCSGRHWSLPSWECGLKWEEELQPNGSYMSLPSWECGLKWIKNLTVSTDDVSLPSWECGLKSWNWRIGLWWQWVTPFVGVWIEIINLQIMVRRKGVTPFVGVWIEINA